MRWGLGWRSAQPGQHGVAVDHHCRPWQEGGLDGVQGVGGEEGGGEGEDEMLGDQ